MSTKIYYLFFISTLLFSQSSINNLYSPAIPLPTIGEGESMHFGFALHVDMPDSDGDGDGFLEDYYHIAIRDLETVGLKSEECQATVSSSRIAI
jgi:hypothetical protein